MVNNCVWPVPSDFHDLSPHQAHVWCFSLEISPEQIKYNFNLLNVDEKNRAQRFKFEKHQHAFIAARGQLRILLSQYLQCDPKAIEFEYNQYGKPKIKNNPHLQFNLSHSEGVALCAITLNNAIGVDIEYMKKDVEMDAIAERFFSQCESNELHALQGEAKIQGFYNAWSRKEAFLKAYGQGLSYSLKNVEVTIIPEQDAKILALHHAQLNAEDWYIQALEPIEGYAAALVVRGQPDKIDLFTLKTSV